MGDKRTLIGSIVDSMLGHLLRYSNWYTVDQAGVYMNGVTEGRRYVVIRRLSTERKNCRPTNLCVEKKKEMTMTVSIRRLMGIKDKCRKDVTDTH